MSPALIFENFSGPIHVNGNVDLFADAKLSEIHAFFDARQNKVVLALLKSLNNTQGRILSIEIDDTRGR